MSRVRYAQVSLNKFCDARQNYEQIIRPNIERVFASYAEDQTNNPLINQKIDHLLEIHIRTYFVDSLLQALNWQLDSNLIPEAVIISESKGTRRFLDYLGTETDTDRPLLVVETKRPNSPPPATKGRIRQDTDFSSIICAGLRGEKLLGEWNDWLNTLRDYVRSIQQRVNHVPARVVLTNGDWLILFTDPLDAFLSEDGPTPEKIFFWQNRDDLERNYTEIFQWLDYYTILKKVPPLTPIELPFFVAGNEVDQVMHGLRLNYIEVPSMLRPSPLVEVLPILFVHSRGEAWFRVEDDNENLLCTIPHEYSKLSEHLQQINLLAKSMLEQINSILKTDLVPTPITNHYNKDEEEFLDLPGVSEIERSGRATQYIIITGANTHFLLPEPTVKNCPHHDWSQSLAMGAECNPGPIHRRSTQNPKVFFRTTELHHCAHRDVANAKTCQIIKENLARCGNRSGKPGQAFCEIVSFEEHLCCRTCIFEEVCTKAEVFHLPCKRPEPER